MVIFSDPAAAVDCAAKMQRKVAGDRDQLGLRIGVHAGELLRDGNDYFGSTVIVARRLCDGAEAGEIVISEEARALIDGTEEMDFEPLGSVVLKGLIAPVPASTLIWSQATAEQA